jgi:hypothetical protein
MPNPILEFFFFPWFYFPATFFFNFSGIFYILFSQKIVHFLSSISVPFSTQFFKFFSGQDLKLVVQPNKNFFTFRQTQYLQYWTIEIMYCAGIHSCHT